MVALGLFLWTYIKNFKMVEFIPLPYCYVIKILNLRVEMNGTHALEQER